MRFGAWNVSSLYRSGSLTAAARELARCKLDLVGEQGVRWEKGGTERAGAYIFYMEKENHQLQTGFFVHHTIVSAFKRVEFVSDRMSYIYMYIYIYTYIYEGRTESHEQQFFACELGKADEGEYCRRWNQLLCYP